MTYGNFPAHLEPNPMVCSRGHIVSPNGTYKPKGCPACARGRQVEPKRKFIKTPTWRETMEGITRSGR